MALRVTQSVIEVLVLPVPNLRNTQSVIEVLINPVVEPNLRVTQSVVEVLILPSTSSNPCADTWTLPAPNPFPLPANGGPQYKRFQEMKGDWGQFGGAFPDGNERFNTIQTARVRRFEIDYEGLDQAQAKVLDDHFYSTRGGISFTITHPRTGEIITGVRYESYKYPEHRRVWAQQRSILLRKPTN